MKRPLEPKEDHLYYKSPIIDSVSFVDKSHLITYCSSYSRFILFFTRSRSQKIYLLSYPELSIVETHTLPSVIHCMFQMGNNNGNYQYCVIQKDSQIYVVSIDTKGESVHIQSEFSSSLTEQFKKLMNEYECILVLKWSKRNSEF